MPGVCGAGPAGSDVSCDQRTKRFTHCLLCNTYGGAAGACGWVEGGALLEEGAGAYGSRPGTVCRGLRWAESRVGIPVVAGSGEPTGTHALQTREGAG